MDARLELERLLARPSPLLLPWLARRVAEDDLRIVASAAAQHLELRPGERWPVVADATAAVLAQRCGADDVDLLRRVLRVLPSVAGHLAPEARRAVADDTVPPLAHPGAAALLREVRAGRPVTPSPAEAAYLLPIVDPVPPGWPELAVTAVAEGVAARPGWYGRAVGARILPLLGPTEVDRVAAVLGAFDTARLSARESGTPEEELAAAHGNVGLLTELAGRVDADLMAELCRAAVLAVRDGVDVRVEWMPDAYSYGYDLPYTEPEPDAVVGRPVRHLNVHVAPAGGDAVVDRPVPADTDLEVLCSVGAFDPRALTADATDATFPDEFLPDAALDLTAVLTVGWTVRTAALHVPARGDSATVRLPLTGRPHGTVIEAELGLYYGVALVQLVALVLPVEGAAGVPTATVTYRLSSSLADLTPFADRSLSVSVSAPSGRSRFLVNGTGLAPHALLAEPARVDTAVRAVRTALYEAHFRVVDGREVSRFDRRQGKPVAELTGDLARLAHCGRRVYLEMFGAQAVARPLPELLRTEGRARRRPPVVQIVDPTVRSAPMPWAAVYDLPLGSDPSAYRPCPSLHDLGTHASGQAVPPVCPYDGDHRQDDGRWRPDQLCPWGFWGLSTLLEHPPHVVGRDLTAVVGEGAHRVFLAADGPDLDERECRTHLAALRLALGDELDHLDRPGADALGAALGEDVDVVYLFCHCGRDVFAAGAPPDPYLHFDRKITPTDVNQWIETAWPAGHWRRRHPLVVINGCHTVETLSGSLTDFVVAFTSWAQGAGVIGTEVTVDQPVAAWAMELFLDALRTRPVGEALRVTRWAMLSRGNVMGLAYTPYCLATLALRERDGAA